eukprot:34836-Rhodomonas_salina.3
MTARSRNSSGAENVYARNSSGAENVYARALSTGQQLFTTPQPQATRDIVVLQLLHCKPWCFWIPDSAPTVS